MLDTRSLEASIPYDPTRRQRVVCVGIVGSSMFIGWNSAKTDPKSSNPYRTLHAELHCLNRMRARIGADRIKKARIYIFRTKKDGSLGVSKPCVYCRHMLEAAGVAERNIYYVDEEGKWQRLGR